MNNEYRKHAGVVSVAIVVSALSSFAAEMPAAWRKTMTNDPSTNHYLAEALKPLGSKDAETLRIFKLSMVLGNMCVGARINTDVGGAYMAAAGYSRITGKAYDDAAFLADDRFKYFDYRKLAHLCAGSNYLFGPEGHLIKGLIVGNTGEPKGSYDPDNPYLKLPPLAKQHS